MHIRLIIVAVRTAVLSLTLTGYSSRTTYDRDGIIEITDTYLDALVAHDPGACSRLTL